jgi:flagellin
MTILNYNVAAQRAATTMTRNDKVMNTAMSRLSTGIKLGQAEDGPATIGVYKGLKVQGVTTRAAVENINNAISYLRTVDDAGAAIESLLIRMKEIAVQGATSTTDRDQMRALNSEFMALGKQWDRIVADTKWNGVQVMTGTDLSVGVGSGSTITVEVDNWTSSIAANAAAGADDLSAIGATTGSAKANTTSTLAGTDNFTFAVADAEDIWVTGNSAAEDITKATYQMYKTTSALEAIGKSRAELGASINALKASANSLVDLADRYESNASAIGDADYASESAKLATAQIVSQAATAMLAQANAQKGTVLALLK